MEREDIIKIIEVRKRLIEVFNSLEGKHDNTALCKQEDIAHEISEVIPMIDAILKDKVNFS